MKAKEQKTGTKTETDPKARSKANVSRCSCTVLRKATRRVSQLYDMALAPSGLKITQRAILAQIGRSETTNISLLADALVMDSGALTHALRPLERDRFIVVEVNPDDRRHRLISLTPRGRAKLAQTDQLWDRAENGFQAALGRTDAELLRTLLQRLISEDFAECFGNGLADSVA